LSGLVLILTRLIHSQVELAVYPAFLVAVVASARLGGWGPGILCTVLSALACNVFFLSPGPFFDPSDRVGHLVEFVLCGTVLTALTGRLRKIHRAALEEIVRRAEAEEAVRRLNAELEDRVRSRTREVETALSELNAFSYSVAHDLRGPLRAMGGFVDLLLEDQGPRLDDTGRSYAEKIGRAARKMDALISGLLEYSRLSREAVPLDDVDLDEAVDWVLLDLGDVLEERGASVQVDRPLGRARANAPALRQALGNLLDNATKFVPPGRIPVTRVRCDDQGAVLRLWVEDNGIGIAPEYRAKVFGVFERLSPGDEVPGTGIGLAIVKRVLERMGGRVGVESEPGKGSSFFLDLIACGVEGKWSADPNLRIGYH
jgi:signal transduction histidine kinase